MKAALACLGAALTVAFAASHSSAQYGYPPQPYYPNFQTAPDMCGAGFYCTNGCTWYGPSYCVYPPFQPYSGITAPALTPEQVQMLLMSQRQQQQMQQQMQQQQSNFQSWVRGPRDYFMWTEAQKERITRETRPPFVPY